MAIVRTTPKETNTSGPAPTGNGATTGNGAAVAPVDRTKSVIQQPGAKAVARPTGTRGGVAVRGTQAPVKSDKAGAFVNDTMTELRRVVWPTKAEVQAGTIVTIGLLVFFSIYIFGLDFIADRLFHLLGLYPNTPVGQ